ncbi:hypothetical protein AB1046_14495 [Promicromonospora sp. Populi]|uniref:hypothetical protein n=1 Tax=Promicromonospora sp. Populi TaxID=3239420 RepID=UPI0034E1EC71
MNEHERLGHPAFDRLAAADPAKHAPDPVQGVLRAKVDALIAEPGPAGHEPAGPGPAKPEPAEPEQRDELAVRRHRRRTPWLVAAAVAGIVAAGGGGYLAGESGVGPASMVADTGAGTESGPEIAAGEPPPTILGQPGEPSPEVAAEAGALQDAERSDADGELSAATRLVFHAGAGLSDVPRTAQVRVDTASESRLLGTYPVISEVAAVERLGDPRFAGAVGSRPAGEPPAWDAPALDGAIPWPVEDVTIESASLTEVRYRLSDNTVLIVPAYNLTDGEGGTWTVIAVDEELLDLAP